MTLTDEEIDRTIECWDPKAGHTRRLILDLHQFAVELKESRAEIEFYKEEIDRLKRQHFRLVRDCGVPCEVAE